MVYFKVYVQAINIVNHSLHKITKIRVIICNMVYTYEFYTSMYKLGISIICFTNIY